jgi:arabinose-5-phosphate isomerase
LHQIIVLKSTEILQIGIDTLKMESESLQKLSTMLNTSFTQAVEEILTIRGRVVVTGIGKSAIIAQKIVATFNSTGTPALYMHAADAIHGDLGMIQIDDVVICISKSGNSPEIKALAPLITKNGNTLIGMVGNTASYLAEHSTYILDTTVTAEACPNNLAPTTSTTAQMAMGDALAVALIKCRDFKAADFAKYHPGGALGKKLYLTLGEIASHNAKPIVPPVASLSECIVAMSQGRMGAVLVAESNKLMGIITDGDLRRMLAKNSDISSFKAKDIMTKQPKVLRSDILAIEGVNFVRENKINHIILQDESTLVGLVHVQDLIKEGLI